MLLVLLAFAVVSNSAVIAFVLARASSGPAPWMRGVQFYLFTPLGAYSWRARRRRKGAEPLTGTPFRNAAGYVGWMVQHAGPKVRPTVLLGPRLGRDAFVVGMPMNPYLVLGPELLVLYGKRPEKRREFDAVVLHEIAHLRARDLWSYLVVTLLRYANMGNALVAVVLTSTLAADGQVAPRSALLAVTGYLGLVLLAELVARQLLRVREHYADLFAARHAGGALRRILRASRATVDRRRVAVDWRAAIRRHPSAARRRAVLDEPARLLAFPPARMFMAGVFAGVSLVVTQYVIPTSFIVPSIVVGVPLTVYLAVGMVRECCYARWHGGRPRAVASATMLAAGLVVGTYLPPANILVGADPQLRIPITVTTLAAVWMGCLFLCLWATFLGMLWTRHDADGNDLIGFMFLGIVPIGLVGAWIFAMLWGLSMRLWIGRYLCSSGALADPAPGCAALGERAATREVLHTYGHSVFTLLMPVVLAATTLTAWWVARNAVAGRGRS